MALSLLPLCPIDQMNKNSENLKVSKFSQTQVSKLLRSVRSFITCNTPQISAVIKSNSLGAKYGKLSGIIKYKGRFLHEEKFCRKLSKKENILYTRT